MTNEEMSDLTSLQEKCHAIRKSAFNVIRQTLRMRVEELKASGYRTIQDAVIGHFTYYEKQIEVLTTEYLKKYPD